MRDYRDAKSMAHTLRTSLAERGVSLTHTDCLELTARILGAKDWNVLSALIQDADKAAAPGMAPAGRWRGPVLPCRDIVVFPRTTLPLFVGRETSINALAEAERGELEVLLVSQKRREDDAPQPNDIYEIGVVADVLGVTPFQQLEQTRRDDMLAQAAKAIGEAAAARAVESSVRLTVRARQRARIVSLAEADGRLTAQAALISDDAGSADGVEQIVQSSRGEFIAFAGGKEALAPAVARAETVAKPGIMADLIAQHAPGSVADKQSVLETLDPLARLRSAVALLPTKAA